MMRSRGSMPSITPLQIATESSAVPKSDRNTTVRGRLAGQPRTTSASATATPLRHLTARPYSTRMDELRKQVDALAHRVQALEDELAIHRLIVRYGLA